MANEKGSIKTLVKPFNFERRKFPRFSDSF